MWKASQACNPPTWIVDMDRSSMLIGVHILKHHFSIEFNSFITLAWNFPFSYLWSSQCDALATGLLRRSFSPAWAHCSILSRLCGAPASSYQLRPVLSFLFHPSTFVSLVWWLLPRHGRVRPCAVQMCDSIVDERELTSFLVHSHTQLLILQTVRLSSLEVDIIMLNISGLDIDK